MNKVDQMWYLLLICHDFATVVIPFFRAVCRVEDELFTVSSVML